MLKYICHVWNAVVSKYLKNYTFPYVLIVNESFFLYRSPTFHNFVKVALTKNPKKRPTAEKLLLVTMSF